MYKYTGQFQEKLQAIKDRVDVITGTFGKAFGDASGGFTYPVVPKGKTRIRVQISAAHNREQLDRAIESFGALSSRT